MKILRINDWISKINTPCLRLFIKKVNDAVKSNDADKAGEALKALQPEIMRGVTKKIIKLNTASRKLSRLSASIKKITKKA